MELAQHCSKWSVIPSLLSFSSLNAFSSWTHKGESEASSQTSNFTSIEPRQARRVQRGSPFAKFNKAHTFNMAALNLYLLMSESISHLGIEGLHF